MSKHVSHWSVADVDLIKSDVRGKIQDAVSRGAEPLAAAKSLLAELEDNDPTNYAAQLRRYVLVVSTLVWHERSGGLKNSEVRHAADLAINILKANNIAPGRSRLSFLYAELYQVLSQIYLKEGDAWLTSWHLRLGHELTTIPIGGAAFSELSLAYRWLRLGNAKACVACLCSLDIAELDSTQKERHFLLLAKALRISRKFNEAKIHLQDKSTVKTEAGILEAEWEDLCIRAQEEQDGRHIQRATRPKGRFYFGPYLLEAFLWAKAGPSRQISDEFPRIDNLLRRSNLGMRPDIFFKLSRDLDYCFDKKVTMFWRLQKLGHLLGSLNKLVAVDKELLFLAAARRLLLRIHNESFLSLVRFRYETLSRTLTDGEHADALGLF